MWKYRISKTEMEYQTLSVHSTLIGQTMAMASEFPGLPLRLHVPDVLDERFEHYDRLRHVSGKQDEAVANPSCHRNGVWQDEVVASPSYHRNGEAYA
jgi:hypothetical protein